jgi:transcriptional regulator with XRE-family HTH domain
MSTGAQLKKYRLAAGLTVEQAAREEGVSKRLWEYWEADEKLPPHERDALTRERLLARWKTKARPPGSSNASSETRGK